MRNKKETRDRADVRLERLARQGLTWEQSVARGREIALRGLETRRRRERGEPDPPKPLKKSTFPARAWLVPSGHVALSCSYRPGLVEEIHKRFDPQTWWSPGLRAWMVAPEHAREAVELLHTYYRHVSMDLGVAGLLGFVILPPGTFADPPEEAVA